MIMIKEFLVKALFSDLIKKEIQKSSRQILPFVTEYEEKKGLEQPVSYEVLYQTYRDEPWVRAIIDLIEKACTALGYMLIPLVKNPSEEQFVILDAFFRNPNPNDTIMEIIGDGIRDRLIYGNGYTEIVLEDNKPKELWSLDSTKMKIMADKHGKVLGYLLDVLQGNKNPQWVPDEIMHFKQGTKGSTLYGLSPLETLAVAITVDKYAQLFNKSFFLHGAKAKGAFMMQDATAEGVERNRDYLKQVSKDPGLAQMDLVLEGKIDYVPLGLNQKDMQFSELRKFIRDEILAVFACPPSLISIIESGNIGAGTGETQIKNFYEQTVIPIQTNVDHKVTKKVIKDGFHFEDWGFELRKRKIAEQEQAEIFKTYIESGIMSPEEARAYLGKPPLKAIEKKLSLRVRGYTSLEEDFTAALKRLFKAFAKEASAKLEQMKLTKLYESLKDVEYENRIYEVSFDQYVFEMHKFPVKEKQLNIENVLEVLSEEKIRAELSRFMKDALEMGAEAGRRKLFRKAFNPVSDAAALRIDSFLRDLAKYLKATIDSSIRHELIEGVRLGETMPEISARIEGALGKPIKHIVTPKTRKPYVKEYSYSASAQLIARSETNRAFNLGLTDAFEQAEIRKVKIITAPDACDECKEAAERGVYSLDEIKAALPVHHLCRCTFVSAD